MNDHARPQMFDTLVHGERAKQHDPVSGPRKFSGTAAICLSILLMMGCPRAPQAIPRPNEQSDSSELSNANELSEMEPGSPADDEPRPFVVTGAREVLRWQPIANDVAMDPGVNFYGPNLAVRTQPLEPEKQLTMEAWFTSANHQSGHSQTLISNTERSGFALKIDSEMFPRLDVRQPEMWTQVSSQIPVTVFEKTHMAATIDDRKLTLFVDGVPVSSVEIKSERVYSDLPVCIGANPDPINNGYHYRHRFVGVIHQCHLTRHIKYTDTFVPANVLEADEHSIWLYNFETETSEKAPDLSGNENHGTLDRNEE